MHKTLCSLGLFLILASTTVQAGAIWRQAQNDQNAVTGRDLITDEHRISLDEAVEYVRRKTGGRILSATTHVNHGHAEHRIKVLTPDNQVRIFIMDEEEEQP